MSPNLGQTHPHPNSPSTIEQRLDQLRHEFQDAVTEHAISFNRISQEFHGRGARHEQLHRLVNTTTRSQLEDVRSRLVRQGEWMASVDRERDRLANQVRNSIGATIDEQKDIKETAQNLAQQIDAIRSGTHPEDATESTVAEQLSSENSVPAFLEIEDHHSLNK